MKKRRNRQEERLNHTRRLQLSDSLKNSGGSMG